MRFILFVFGLALSRAVFAEGISTHVLDLASGVGGKDVPVVLELQSPGGAWRKLASGVTDQNGRIKSFGDAVKVQKGKYRLSFDMTNYSAGPKNPFFPEISVVFVVADPTLHFHVPVVVSPYGYSTYRGN